LKTFRLVWIFFHIEKVKPQNFLFSKLHLVVLIMILLAIDAIILGVWTGADMLESTRVDDSNSEIKFWMLCRSDHDVAFIVTLAVYKCVLVGLGAIMAFLSRNLPNVLNEAYYIGLSVYNVGLFIAIIFPVTAVLNDDPEGQVLVRNLGIIFAGLSSVLLILAPKFYVILRGKHGAAENDASNYSISLSLAYESHLLASFD